MRKNRISTAGRDFDEILEKNMDGIVLERYIDVKKKSIYLLKKRSKLPEKTYLMLLRAHEEHILSQISKYREKKEKTRNNFLIVKNKNKNFSKLHKKAQILYEKTFYHINYVLNGKIFRLNYKDYEEIKDLIKKKKDTID